MTDKLPPADPFYRRPRIFDPAVGERRLFWDELDDEQKFAELNYHAYANQRILERLHQPVKTRGK